MSHYQLSEEDTKAVLLSVVGPDTNAAKFWDKYRKEERAADDCELRIPNEVRKFKCLNTKEEPVLKEEPPMELHDNQLGEKEINPDDLDGTELEPEDMEEEHGDDDPEVCPTMMDETCPRDHDGDDDEPADAMTTTSRDEGDDQDSPQAGAAAVEHAAEEMTVVAPEQPEPVIEPPAPMNDVAELAKKELLKRSRDDVAEKLLQVPAPGRTRQGRKIVQAVRVDSRGGKATTIGDQEEPAVKRLRSMSFLSLSLILFEVSSFFVVWFNSSRFLP